MTSAIDTDRVVPGATEHAHGPGSPVPVQSRAERFASAVHADFPEVTGRELEWRLTPVALMRAEGRAQDRTGFECRVYQDRAGDRIQHASRRGDGTRRDRLPF